jgi:predicted nucleic acid-binding protein
MTSPTSDGPTGPDFLFDACTLINLSYSDPIASLFRERYEGRAGWVKVVHTELVRQRMNRPPNHQAGQAFNRASAWLSSGVQVVGESNINDVEVLRQRLLAGQLEKSQFEHLGEATSIVVLRSQGHSRFLTDDHDARFEARQAGVNATSSVGILSGLIRIGEKHDALVEAVIDGYLDALRQHGRMHVGLRY